MELISFSHSKGSLLQTPVFQIISFENYPGYTTVKEDNKYNDYNALRDLCQLQYYYVKWIGCQILILMGSIIENKTTFKAIKSVYFTRQHEADDCS